MLCNPRLGLRFLPLSLCRFLKNQLIRRALTSGFFPFQNPFLDQVLNVAKGRVVRNFCKLSALCTKKQQRSKMVTNSGPKPLSTLQFIGGVGEWLKPAVLKNKIACSLICRKFN